MAVNESNSDLLLGELATTMKEQKMVQPPEWASFVKTGAQAQRRPDDPDWWYMRSASILRRVYMQGPIGVSKLRNWYGARKKRGSRPERHHRAGGKIVRVCLQQLESAGLIAKEKTGRKITPKGQSLLDKTAASVAPRREAKPVKKAQSKKKAVVKKAPAKKKAVVKKALAKKKEEVTAEKPKAKEVKEKAPAKPKAEKKPAAKKALPDKKAPAKKKEEPKTQEAPAEEAKE